jgi:hypothetical protein
MHVLLCYVITMVVLISTACKGELCLQDATGQGQLLPLMQLSITDAPI